MVGKLQQIPALTTLDLSGCQLSGPTVTCLCTTLKCPGCRLQTLRWRQGWEGCWERSLSALGWGGCRGFPRTLKRNLSQGPPEATPL